MRRNWLLLPGLMLLVASHCGCHQTTGTSPLTPIGPLGTVAPLAPVSGGTAATSLSPLGQPTRVPPPPTGSYSTPNNYMGGAPTVSQVIPPGVPYDSFSQVAPNQNAIGLGVAPTSYVESNRSNGRLATATAQNPLTPPLDGMRVIDMTQSPPPPGYRSSFQPPLPPYVNPQTLGPQNYGGQNVNGAYQPSYSVPPQEPTNTPGREPEYISAARQPAAEHPSAPTRSDRFCPVAIILSTAIRKRSVGDDCRPRVSVTSFAK